MSPSRPRGFLAGILAGLCWFGILWFWIVGFRFTYEMVVVAEGTVGSVRTNGDLHSILFPTGRTEIPLPSDAERRIFVIGGFRSISPFTTVVLRVGRAGSTDQRHIAIDLKAPLFARHCTAVITLGPESANAGPCVASETSWFAR